jgi:predicted  nucleic acid-binding Zn-ribbon protein
MRHILLEGKNKLDSLNEDIKDIKEEKRKLEINLSNERNFVKNLNKKIESLNEKLSKKGLFSGAYETVSATVSTPFNFVKSYAGDLFFTYF